MRTLFTILCGLAPGLFVSSASAQQQTACLGPDENTTWLVEQVTQYTAPPDSAFAEVRDSLRLVSTPATQVVVVTDNAVCAAAASAYGRAITDSAVTRAAASRLSGRVYVIKAGVRYVVVDPSYYLSEPDAWLKMIFDDSFNFLRYMR